MIEFLSVGPKQGNHGWPIYPGVDPLYRECEEVTHFEEQPLGVVASYSELRDLADKHDVSLEHIEGLEQMVRELGEMENERGPMSGPGGHR